MAEASDLTMLPPVLDARAMREADRRTIEELGIPGFTLMESAGRETASIAREMLEVGFEVFQKSGEAGTAHIICLCGKGNNGGDGFVIARYLASYGHVVSVIMMTEASSYKGDAASNLAILERFSRHTDISLSVYDGPGVLEKLPGPDLIVDALLGTGLSSSVREPLKDVIGWINGMSSPVLAVDIPSGLSSDTGQILGCAVNATETVTLGAIKAGLILERGPDVCGVLHVVDIGIPHYVLEKESNGRGCARVSNDAYLRGKLPKRGRSDHKYSTGPSIVAGGSISFPGAVALAARGAARAGSGYVICLCPDPIRNLLLEKLDEIPVESWIDPGDSLADLIDRLGTRWTKARALLVGPGLGRSDSSGILVKNLLSSFSGPIVIDADGLFAMTDQKDWVKKHSGGQWIFTPHEGEFRRLTGGNERSWNRIEAARTFSAEWNVTLLLKGLPSITASADGRVIVNSTGNPAVGTAGSGDVLAGIITGLLAQGLGPFDAAACGVHLAGTAADFYVEEQAAVSMVATDVLENLPRVIALFL